MKKVKRRTLKGEGERFIEVDDQLGEKYVVEDACMTGFLDEGSRFADGADEGEG